LFFLLKFNVFGVSVIVRFIHQFDLDKAINDKGLELLLEEKRYVTAHDILEELKQMLVLKARMDLLDTVRENDFYSILAGESCTDVDYKVSDVFVEIF
jgi:hypothetical protein